MRIVVPANANLNALFEFLSKAQAIDEVVAASSAPDAADGVSRYAGESTLYVSGQALPRVEPITQSVYPSEQEAQAAKDEIVRAEIQKLKASEKIAA